MAPPPSSSRINMRAARKNRRRPPSLWSRLPAPRVIADACGRALRRTLPIVAASAAVVAVGGGAFAGYRFLTTSPRFAIAEIEVHGNVHETADGLRALLPVHAGDNVFAPDLDAVGQALLTDPWVATAEAHRVLPNTIVVDVRERIATAVVDLDGLYLVEADGHVFKRAQLDVGDGAGLPIVTGLARDAYLADPDGTARTIRDSLATLDSWRTKGERPTIGEVHLDPHGAITLSTYDDAVAIQLGTPSPDLEARMQTFDAAWAELGDAERARARAVHVDTQPDHVTIAFN